MKRFKTIFAVALVFPLFIFSQEDNDTIVKSEVKLERAAYESTALIDNQTNVLNTKGTLEMVMNHRFDLVNSDNNLIGIYGAANIRIALAYAVHDRVTVGFGTSKSDANRLQDFNLKAAILRQTRENEMPVSVTYYGNFTIDARKKEKFNLVQDRYSFFNQLIIARRFSPKVSFHVAPSISHYNLVDKTMENDMIAVTAGGRVKISPQTSIIAEYSQPITSYEDNTPEPGVSLGVEFSTGSHAFQIFVTNYKGIVQQKNFMYNQNNFFDGDFMIGFNITRLWHL